MLLCVPRPAHSYRTPIIPYPCLCNALWIEAYTYSRLDSQNAVLCSIVIFHNSLFFELPLSYCALQQTSRMLCSMPWAVTMLCAYITLTHGLWLFCNIFTIFICTLSTLTPPPPLTDVQFVARDKNLTNSLRHWSLIRRLLGINKSSPPNKKLARIIAQCHCIPPHSNLLFYIFYTASSHVQTFTELCWSMEISAYLA